MPLIIAGILKYLAFLGIAQGVTPSPLPKVALVSLPAEVGISWHATTQLEAFLQKPDVGAVVFCITEVASWKCACGLAQEIKYLKNKYRKPIYVYYIGELVWHNYIASITANRVYALPESKIYASYPQLSIEKHVRRNERKGIKMNVITAGKCKGIFDPNCPLLDDDQPYIDAHYKRGSEHLLEFITDHKSQIIPFMTQMEPYDYICSHKVVSQGILDGVGTLFNVMHAVSKDLKVPFKKLFPHNVITHTIIPQKNDLQRQSIAIISFSEYEDAQADHFLTEFSSQLIDACINPTIAGIVIPITCHGGSWIVGHRIFNEILQLKKLYRKPIIAYVETAYSCGYLIAAATDWIVASAAAEVGSIGVRITVPDYSERLKKKGIDVIFSEGMIPRLDSRIPMSESEKQWLESSVNQTHQAFIAAVEKQRPQAKGHRDEWMDAQLFFAPEALKLGLIDQIGGFFDALDVCQKMVHRNS